MAHPAIATTYQVNSLADHGPNTLRAAIATAVSGDTITFARWLYEKQIHLYSEITINKNLTIKGDLNDDHKPDITLDGQRKTRIFNITAGSRLALESVELMRGHANEGGAIANWGTLYIKYSRFIRNESVGLGGAIFNKGFLNIETTTAMDNMAWSHGGVIYNNGTLRIQTSTFAHNMADKTGGVIYNDYKTAFIKKSTFSYNMVKHPGSWQNTDNKGSVLYNMMGTVEFRDSTLVDNVSSPVTMHEEPTYNGSNSELFRTIQRRNIRARMMNGGTIYNYGGADAKEIILRSTVITGSQGRNCGGLGGFSAGASIWSDDNTCVQQRHYNDHGTDRGSPKLGPLADNGGYTLTHMPLSGSGLINGSPTTCAAHDQRGAARDSQCDIGSVEADHSAPSRALPTPINTTPPEEHNEDIAALNRRITTLHILATERQAAVVERDATIAAKVAEIETLTATIATLRTQVSRAEDAHRSQLRTQLGQVQAQRDAAIARLNELEDQYLNRMEVQLAASGKMTHVAIDGESVLYEHQMAYKVPSSPRPQQMSYWGKDSVQHHADGSKISSGHFRGENGVIYWRVVSTMQAGTDFHTSRYEFSSDQPFGDVSISSYTDVDFGSEPWSNALIVGGENHPRRLLVVDGVQPTVGMSVGVRNLKNAEWLGWLGSQEAYFAYGGDVLEPGRLTGPQSDWQTFTPDQTEYPGAVGYGPADMAVAIGIRLKPTVKLATFEITTVGAPDGNID